MKNYLLWIVLLFLCLAKTSKAQQHLVDSLTKQLQQPMIDSNRAISMMRLAIDYEVVDTAKAYQAYREAIKFSYKKKLYFQLARIYHNQSYLLSTAARYTEALASMDTAILFYQAIKTSKAKKWEGNAYGDKANYLRNINELQQALEYNLKSISLFEQLGLENELVTRYCNVSTLFGDIHEYAKQEEYAHKALACAKRSDAKINPQMAYTILALSYSMQNDDARAKAYLDSARISFNEYSNVDFMVTYYLVAAQVYRKLNSLDSSLYYFKQSLEVSKKYNYSYGKAESQIQMGAISILQKKYVEAEKYLIPGIAEAEAINSFSILDDGYKYLSDLYSVTDRYELAYVFFQKHKELSDSIFNMESKKNITDLEKKYDTEKKDIQLKLQEAKLQRKDTWNYILIAGAVTILIIALMSYRNYRHKQKLQQHRITELETEKQLTATEAVLKGEEKERSRLAKDLHDGLGGMLSGIKYSFNTMKENLVMTPENHQAFERSMDMLDSSIKEMRRVAHNMMPEALVKFGLDVALKDFCNDINQSGALQVKYQSIGLANENIEQTKAITIYRIVQELINNTLKHAAAKTAIVQVTKTNEQLTVTVEDDGKGFDTALLKQAKGMGWSNIQHRVDFLKGKLDVDSETGKGTSVHIEFDI